MSYYCYWIRTDELPNGDLRIQRLRGDGVAGVDVVMIVPVQERAGLARKLIANPEAIEFDIDRHWNEAKNVEAIR
jgi:hypothetical protein